MSNLVTKETFGTVVDSIVTNLSEHQLTTEKLAQTFFDTKRLTKFIEQLDTTARDKVLSVLRDTGERFSAAGSLRLDVGGYRLEARVKGTGYDDKKVEALLRTKGLDPTAGMDATITYKTNIEKLCRVLTDNELSICKKPVDYSVMSPKPLTEVKDE